MRRTTHRAPSQKVVRSGLAIVSIGLPMLISSCFFSLEDVVAPGVEGGISDSGLGDLTTAPDTIAPPQDAFVPPRDTGPVFDAGNPCGANLMSDPQNCGRCGRNCIEGSCQTGVCTATVIVSGTSLRGIAIDGQYLYYSSANGLIRTTKVGSPVSSTLTATTAPNAAIAVDNSYVFAAQTAANGGTPSVMRVFKSGTGQVPTVLSALGDPSSIALDTTRVYWSSGTALFAAPKDATDAGMQALLNVGAVVTSLTGDTGSLFFTAGSQVATCTLPSCTTKTVLATGQQPYGITTFNGNVYFTDVGSNTIQMCTSGCLGGATILASGQSTPFGIAADSSAVVWTNRGDNLVMTCDLPSCANGPMALARTGQNAGAVVIDNAYAYWINGDPASTGSVMRAPR